LLALGISLGIFAALVLALYLFNGQGILLVLLAATGIAAIVLIVTGLLTRKVEGEPAGKLWSWLAFSFGILYFLLPLLATFEFSVRIRREGYTFDAYALVFADGRFQASFVYSLLIGVATITVGILLVVPAAYYVRLRAPHLRPIIEFVTLLPLIIPPIILVFGYIRMYNSSSILPLTNSNLGTDALLTLAYVALAMPYMYRAVDTGLRTIDVQTLTEAATIMGANQVTILARVIFPNIIVAVLSGAFLTLAIVVGEFTIASLLNRQVFGVYMQNVGANRAFEPAALAVVSFVITWGAMGMIQLLTRFAPKTAPRNT
jgi:putative spermidine/putrescine transport system permease protein